MKKRILLSILALAMLLPLPLLALEAHDDEVVFLDKEQIIDRNYYAAGSTVEIYGGVNGDLFLAGQKIIVDSENINGDIFVAGENITIRGKINGSVRVAGQYLDIIGEVTGNVLFFGQTLNINPEAVIGGHVSSWGQQVNIHGKINGQLEGAMEQLLLSGAVAKNVDVMLSTTNRENGGLRVTDGAIIGGELNYKALTAGQISENAEIALGVNFEEFIRQAKKSYDKSYFWGVVLKFFMMLVVGMVLIYLLPKFFTEAYQSVKTKPVKSLLWGLVFLIITPIASVILMITVIGLPLAFIILGLWVMMLYVATIIAAWIVGSYLYEKFLSKYKWSNISILALGIVGFCILTKIPLVGWLIIFILILMSWGTLKQIFQKT